MAGSLVPTSARISIGITGHREGNAAFRDNRAAIEAAIGNIFDIIERAVADADHEAAGVRLFTALAQGTDLMAADQALARNWPVSAITPFSRDLNIAINAYPDDPQKTADLIDGLRRPEDGSDPVVNHMRGIAAQADCFELAEQDRLVTQLFAESAQAPDDLIKRQAYDVLVSDRAAAASRVVIEHSDMMIALWDGVTAGATGGTHHCMETALREGVPVIWVDAAAPECWTILRDPEELDGTGSPKQGATADGVTAVIERLLERSGSEVDTWSDTLQADRPPSRSKKRFHGYRRIEAIFGGRNKTGRFASLRQVYETPDEIAAGSHAELVANARALPGSDQNFVERIEQSVLRRFAAADGLSSYLSDAYRGGMIMNFLLSFLAIAGGIIYLPFVSAAYKWPFALTEFLLLLAILAITAVGTRKRWHSRWFQTRRVTEYLRHAPMLLLVGVARPSGRWPKGTDTNWPENYVRKILSGLALPKVVITQDYLRAGLKNLLLDHAVEQRNYHLEKARGLTKVHHNLDHLSEWLFKLAVLSVTTYLVLVLLGELRVIPTSIAYDSAKIFTVLGAILPALGATFAGIRYFGDFERFAAISEVTAEKLTELERRIHILLARPDADLRFSQVSDIAHAIDDIVVAEIESWQSVFSGKRLSVPV